MSNKITVYSTPTCVYCKLAKEFFAENNLGFEDFDVSEDRDKLQEMVEKSGQMGVPVISIDEKIIIGFDEAKIREILKI